MQISYTFCSKGEKAQWKSAQKGRISTYTEASLYFFDMSISFQYMASSPEPLDVLQESDVNGGNNLLGLEDENSDEEEQWWIWMRMILPMSK